MNSVENLKSTQLRKLFKIFKSSCMQSLNVFGVYEGFLHEHLTGGSLLRLFPHPADPAASFALLRRTSLTTSPAASANPLTPHWRLLPVYTCATAEAPPPVSTPFPASASGFSCSCMYNITRWPFPLNKLRFPLLFSRRQAHHGAALAASTRGDRALCARRQCPLAWASQSPGCGPGKLGLA
jgi:hypothetical protein